MSQSGEFIDHYFLTAVAKANNRDIILIPSVLGSCTHPPGNPFLQRIYGGLPTPDNPEVPGQYPPLFLGYLEDNLYLSGRFQAIEIDPDSDSTVVLDYIRRGRVTVNTSSSVRSFQTFPLPTRHVPMVNMPDSLVDMVLSNCTTVTTLERSVLQAGVGLTGRTTVQSASDVSVFPSPSCGSSPARKKGREENLVQHQLPKKPRTVS